jgi:hypothetical protein
MSKHPVQACRVQCPIQGSVDVDRCYSCSRFQSIAGSRKGTAIRCNTPSSRAAIERQVFVGGFVVMR